MLTVPLKSFSVLFDIWISCFSVISCMLLSMCSTFSGSERKTILYWISKFIFFFLWIKSFFSIRFLWLQSSNNLSCVLICCQEVKVIQSNILGCFFFLLLYHIRILLASLYCKCSQEVTKFAWQCLVDFQFIISVEKFCHMKCIILTFLLVLDVFP